MDEFGPPLRLAWRFARGGYVWGGPTVVQGVAYVPGDGLIALKLDSGEMVWRNDQVRANIGYTSATHWNNAMYVCGLNHLYALEAQSGKLKFAVEFGSAYSSPCIDRGTVYWGAVGRGYRSILAADARSGEIKWRFDTGLSIIHYTPALLEGVVFCGSVGNMYALDADTGNPRWHVEFPGGHPFDTASVYEHRILVSIEYLGFLALDALSGETLWHYKTQYGPFTAACVAEQDGVAYVASRRLHAVSVRDGAEVWASDEFGFGTSAPIVVGDHLFIGGGDYRCVYAFDRHTGKKVWEYPTGDMVFSSPAYADGRLVVGCHDGYVYCFEQA